jgi:hypothetical protein
MARPAETCVYLESRGLGSQILSAPRFAGTWRLDHRGNVLFAHRNESGTLTGFEIKNRGFTSFATGGTKTAWESNARADDKGLVVAESAIDALSHYALHLPDSARCRYLSTAGAPSSRQLEMLDRLFARLPASSILVAAVDRDAGGDRIAAQLEGVARSHPHLTFRRHSPQHDKDWNDALQRSLRRERAGPDLGR